MKRSTGRSVTSEVPTRPASLLFTTRLIPCHTALALAALLMAADAADAFQARKDDIHKESANVEYGHTSNAHKLVKAGEESAAAPALGVSMTPQLADNLALLFDRFGRSEFILCLEGENKDGKMMLRDFRMPHIAFSRPTSAAVHPDGGCDQYDNIVGTLHNHPASYPEDRGRESSNCYLSGLDIQSWLEYSEYEYTTVLCGPRTWAWWHRSQVGSEKLLAFPKEQQLHGSKTASVKN